MPVKGKRHARKTQHDPSPIMYTSSQDSNDSDASAASSPPAPVLDLLEFEDTARETMTDTSATNRTVGYTTDLNDPDADSDLLRAAVVPAPAPALTAIVPRKAAQRDDTLRAADGPKERDGDREQGHVRSPVLAR